jgi:hypothetical protein
MRTGKPEAEPDKTEKRKRHGRRERVGFSARTLYVHNT